MSAGGSQLTDLFLAQSQSCFPESSRLWPPHMRQTMAPKQLISLKLYKARTARHLPEKLLFQALAHLLRPIYCFLRGKRNNSK